MLLGRRRGVIFVGTVSLLVTLQELPMPALAPVACPAPDPCVTVDSATDALAELVAGGDGLDSAQEGRASFTTYSGRIIR